MDDHDLDNAEAQLSSLLHKCESVLRNSTLSPSRRSMMTRRVEALRTALSLVADARDRSGS
ncbi:hypothetical protein [Brachybacterium subflavum]|uniref:hypothetical protein n=1 Tax=Brachybacterium subflavum TaxID=2585206 RepID=UPI00126660CF|nr:hypothetical protein [Brachybacterium subflavum]